MTKTYIDDDAFLDGSSYLDDAEAHDKFEEEYERLFSDKQVAQDVGSFERDAVTGRKAKKPRMSALNKAKISKHEMDELFL